MINPVKSFVTHGPMVPCCDVNSFHSQGQFCQLTCAGGGDLSNHTRMSTIQSRRLDEKA